MHLDERSKARSLLRTLAGTPPGERLILGDSSGLYTASERIPALTEDLVFLIDADWAASHEREILSVMEGLGFEHEPGTCSFVSSDGTSIDLVGYSHRDATDHIGGGATLPIMVYADLGAVTAAPEGSTRLPDGGWALTPAGLAVVKLLTVRVEKGAKDKLQALLLIDENRDDPAFQDGLRSLLERIEPDRIEDAIADSQAALLALSADPLRSDPQSSGYASLSASIERGLAELRRMIGTGT